MSKKIWFITGARRGMGADFAKAALGAGHAVVETGRNGDAVAKALRPSNDLLGRHVGRHETRRRRGGKAAKTVDASPWLAEKIILSVHTGLRRGSLFHLRWDQVDFLNRVLRIPRTKSGRPHAVPLNATVLTTLQALPLPAQEGGALTKLELGGVGTGTTRRTRLSENRRDDLTPFDRPYQDWAVEYDVVGKQRAHLRGCRVTSFAEFP